MKTCKIEKVDVSLLHRREQEAFLSQSKHTTTMKKEIRISAEKASQMDWVLDERDQDGILVSIDTNEKNIKALANDAVTELPEYTFDYDDTIQSLYEAGLLPSFPGNRSFIYNDDEVRLSAIVCSASVAVYVGISEVELNLYASIDELNADVYGFSFADETDRPEYPMAECNEI